MSKLYHYYHVYADGDWLPIVREHINELIASGLANALQTFNVGIVGDWRKRDNVIEYLQDRQLPGMQWIITAEEDEGYEQVTLDKLKFDVTYLYDQNDIVLYAHTKGAAYGSAHQTEWRSVMQFRCVYEWKLVIEAMKLGKWDTAGCYHIIEKLYEDDVPVFAGVHGGSEVQKLLLELSGGAGIFENDHLDGSEPKPVRTRVHYSGNYWWSTVQWLRRLPTTIGPNRHDAEMWIGAAAPGRGHAPGNDKPRALDLEPGSPFTRLRHR